jgi:PAS domain S-box-containing protein
MHENNPNPAPGDIYNKLIANNPFGVFLVDGDFRLREFSKGAQAIFANVQNPIGRDFEEVVRLLWPEPFVSEAVKRFRHTLRSGEPYQAPSVLERRADTGVVEQYDWQIVQVVLPGGSLGVVCYFYDLSNRARAEHALAQSEAIRASQSAELDLLYSQAPLGLALLDADLRFVRINEALAQINGMSIEAHLGRTVGELLPEIRESAEDMLRGVLTSGTALTDVVITGITPSMPGKTREWREQFFPIKSASGDTYGVGIICEEMTERRKSQRDLQQRTAELETLLDAAPVGIAFFDREHRYLRINAELAETNGRPVEEHLGRSFAEMRPELYGPLGALLDSVFETGIALRNLNVSGPSALVADETRHWLANYFPVHGETGEVQSVGAWVIDVTEEQRKKEELERLKDELESRVVARTAALTETNFLLSDEIAKREAAQAALLQSQKLDALGRLTSGIAHDFGNVVQAITSGFELIEKWSDDPRVLEVVRHSIGAAQRGTGLIKQLLAFARQETIAPQTVDLRAFLKDAWPLLSRSAGAGIALSRQCPDDIGSCRVDPSLLEAALINLVINARDAMPDGGSIDIAVHAVAAGAPRPDELGGADAIAITVTDTGTGMTPEVAAKVIEPFFTTKPVGEGTGLGLAMVHGFVTQSGGAMRIASTPGEGTSITLYLRAAASPLRVDRPLEDATSLAQGFTGTEPLALRRKRVLIIDDDDAVRSLTSALIAELGYDVLEATGGKAALAALRAEPAALRLDAVLSDIAMPGMSGIELAAQIGAEWPDLPVLLMTGQKDLNISNDRMVLAKPFTRARLASAIELLLSDAQAASGKP